MSDLEHLIENGLIRLSRDDLSYEEWMEETAKDSNWTPWAGIDIDDLWDICQYVQYVWVPELQCEIEELRDQLYGDKECLKQNV